MICIHHRGVRTTEPDKIGQRCPSRGALLGASELAREVLWCFAMANQLVEGVAEAFADKRPAMHQLHAKDLGRVYLDVRKAATAVLATVARIEPYAAEIRRLHAGDVDEVAELRTCALAAMHADIVAYAPVHDPLPAVADEAYAVRRLMLSSARVLSQHNLLPAARVDRISTTRGYAAVAADLHALVELFDAHWSTVHDKTPVTNEELVDARTLSERIMSEVIARQARGAGPRAGDEPDPMSDRKRAFALMVKQHRRVRKAMAFIVDAQNLDAVVPPLAAAYVYRNSPRRSGPRLVTPGALDVDLVTEPGEALARAFVSALTLPGHAPARELATSLADDAATTPTSSSSTSICRA